jgi:FkbM family methyltransferase
MTRRIFLDVGANTGQSLAAALDPIFRFDEIVCFEPVELCWPYLQEIADLRAVFPPTVLVRIEHFGLWNRSCEWIIHEPGRLGGSVWHKDKARSDASELCQFVRATDWFQKNVDHRDIVYLKLNCEGAECDILDDLLDSNEFAKVWFVMIDFDVRKIASQKHREAELRTRLEPFGFPRVAFSKDVMRGPTHEDRIKNWLRAVEA